MPSNPARIQFPAIVRRRLFHSPGGIGHRARVLSITIYKKKIATCLNHAGAGVAEFTPHSDAGLLAMKASGTFCETILIPSAKGAEGKKAPLDKTKG